MTPERVARLLLEYGVVEIRSDPDQWFTWASGARAPIYCDHRLLLSQPSARGLVADALAEAIQSTFADLELVAGTATAGIPHAAWVAERLDLPMVYVRGSAKGHGRQKQIEGRALEGERVVLIEDLISFGGSAAAAAEALEREGGKLIGVQGIFQYGFPAAERRLAELGVPCQTLTSYDVLLDCMDLDARASRLLLDWREQLEPPRSERETF